jgi:hypothetical protein
MANLYNFNKHITNIIKLRQNGFKKKGNHFYRVFQDYIEEIFIQSSNWNGRYNISNEFYINFYLINDDKWIIHERIPNKPTCLAWKYKNEDDLKKLLEIASEIIINYCLTYFKEIEKYIIENKISNKEENKIIFNNIFYWK